MRPRPRQPQIRPKISTMPRQQTEAAAYLDIYKLVNEKKRLQQELTVLEERRDRIQERLGAIEDEIQGLETTAHILRDHEVVTVRRDAGVRRPMAAFANPGDFTTFCLEY